MKVNKSLLAVLSMFLILLVFISSASASDVNETRDVLSVDESVNLENNETSILSTNNNDVESNENILRENTGSYAELANRITEKQKAGAIQITLDKDCIYTYDSGSTIEIGTTGFKIDGNGATIDMAGSNIQVFEITANNVIINNLTIKNVKFYGYGGAIGWSYGANGTVSNCTFTNNTAQYGSAIYWDDGANGTVSNCTFTNNAVTKNGGAICWYYSANGAVSNCIFTNNTASEYGGAIYWAGDDGIVSNCNFINNAAHATDGGAIYWYRGANGTVSNCTFTNNTAPYGGAIEWYHSANGAVTNCTFTNNTAHSTGGAIEWYYSANSAVTNCTFTNNTAHSTGGAIEWYNSANGAVTNCALVNNNAPTGSEIYIEANDFNLNNNWWGSNNHDWNKLTKGYVPSVYAVLNLTADPTEIDTSGQSNIATKFVWNGTNTDATSSLPKRNVKLTTNGTLTETEGDVGLTSQFSATSGGIYYVNATVDNEILGVNVNVNGSAPKKDLNLNASTFTLGENITVIVTGFENATGNITVTAGDNNYTSSIMMGMAFVSIPKSDKNITAYIYYPGDDNYNNASTTVDIIAKKDLNLTAVAEPVTVGENATIIITGFENATGNVMVIAGRGFYNVTIMNGTAKAITKGLNNTTTAYILYLGDDNYNMAFTSVNITVNPNPDKKNLTLNATSEPIIAGENATIVVTGFENATGDVTARIDGGLLSTTIVNGTATFNVPGLTSSTTAYISYGGNGEYNAASTTVNITVIPKSDVVIVAENVTKYYGGSERLVVNVYDSELNPIANKTVSITINRITYTRTTDENGTVSLAINLGSGTYGAIIQVDSTSVKSSITVLSTLTGKDITKYYRNATQYSVQVFDTTGKAVGAGEVVTFNVNGRFYNRTTDENGITILNINLPQGEYVITAINPVTGEMHSNNINVLPVVAAKDITMKYMDGTQFVATLVDGQGNPYKDQFVTFNVNGIFYNRLTDSNGQAALNIRLPPGEYIITSSFNGCNIANKITVMGVL